jgi:DNA polymerase (family 10)
VEGYVLLMDTRLHEQFPDRLISITGSFRRHLEILDEAEWITTIPAIELTQFFTSQNLPVEEVSAEELVVSAKENISLRFRITSKQSFYTRLLKRVAVSRS